MLDKKHCKDYDYQGVLSTLCRNYVEEKRAVGLQFNTESRKLAEFARFSQSYELPDNTLTEEVVKAWIARRPNDADKTVYHRFGIVKGLAEYMTRMGYSAYCPALGDIPKLQFGTYTPYIFTHNEILDFFDALDSSGKSLTSYQLRLQNMMKQIFRLLYCCGLRVSEACSLTIDDINWEESVLLVRDSKFDKARYIPMSAEMTNNLKEYVSLNIHTPYLFPNLYGKILDRSSVYRKFRETLDLAGISHRGKGFGPRVHDFRHTFSVHCLQKWIASGVPVTSALPRLSVYLGHSGIGATEKYLRMTAEVYPDIVENLSKAYGYIIPKEVYSDEAN